MARKIMMLTVILIATMFVLGNNSVRDYKEHTEYVMLGANDTRDGIAWDFYDKDKRGICWDEFRYEIGKLNEHLYKNGNCPRPGDVIVVKYYD